MAIETFNVLSIFQYPVPIIGPTMVGSGKIFKIVLKRQESAVLNSNFASNKPILLI